MMKPKYQLELDRYLDNPNDAYYLRIIGNKAVVLTNINLYIVQADKELKKKLIELYNNMDDIYYKEISNEHLKDVLFKYRETSKTNHYELLCVFLYEDGETIKKFIKDNNVIKNDYMKMYKYFKKTFPNQNNERKQLVDVYNKYMVAKNIDDLIEKTNGQRDRYEDRLVELYLSKKSIIEYASNTGTRLSQVNNTVNRYLDNQKNMYYKMALEVSNRSNEDIIKTLVLLAKDLKDNKDLDILYYFDYTKLCIQDFRTIIEPYFSNEEVRVILDRVKKLKSLNNDIIKDAIINGATIISGVEVTSEEKTKVFDYIESKDYPKGVYSIVLRKYVNGDLDIDLELAKKVIKK